MAVTGAGIAKNLVLARRHGAEDFTKLTKRHAAERQVLVAEATQQRGQACEPLPGIGLDVQRVRQYGVFDVAAAGVKFADECAGADGFDRRLDAGHRTQSMGIIGVYSISDGEHHDVYRIRHGHQHCPG